MKNWHPRALIYQDPVKKSKSVRKSPPFVLSVGFLFLILLGTCGFLLPGSSLPGQNLSILEALFTAASAVTITGLSTIDPASRLSTQGLILLTILIQLGGLGFVTFAVIVSMTLGAKMSFDSQHMAAENLGVTNLSKVFKVSAAVLVFALCIELAGFIILYSYFEISEQFKDYTSVKKLGYAAFFTVSAYNNAGFSLYEDSLMSLSGTAVPFMLSLQFILGGLGFVVLLNIWEKRKWSKLSESSQVVLKATLILNLIAFILILLLEYQNPHTLGNLDWMEKVYAAWFSATTPRSAGFNMVPTDQLTDASTLLTMALMFIGGGSLSTASGIKIGTFIVLLAATRAYLLQRDQVTIRKRSVSTKTVRKALSLTLISIILLVASSFIALATQTHLEFLDISFEVLSALFTVGLSRGVTAEFNIFGQLLLIFLMFIGRVGPLTMIYLIASPKKTKLQYLETEVQVG